MLSIILFAISLPLSVILDLIASSLTGTILSTSSLLLASPKVSAMIRIPSSFSCSEAFVTSSALLSDSLSIRTTRIFLASVLTPEAGLNNIWALLRALANTAPFSGLGIPSIKALKALELSHLSLKLRCTTGGSPNVNRL